MISLARQSLISNFPQQHTQAANELFIMLKCKWKPKLYRYSDKVINELLPIVCKSENLYVKAFALEHLKYWKTSRLNDFKVITDSLQERIDQIDTEKLLSLFKYAVLAHDQELIKSLMKRWESFGFALKEQDRFKMLVTMKAQVEALGCKEVLEKNEKMELRSGMMRSFIGQSTSDYIEISRESNVVQVNKGNRTFLFFALTQSEPAFSEVLDIIEKFKVKNIVLPFQNTVPEISRKEIQSRLQERLKDTDKYKATDVHQLVYENTLGVKSLSVPWTLVLKNPESSFFTFLPNVNTIKQLSQDFLAVEQNVKTCMMIDTCRILDVAAQSGCYLCSRTRLYPTSYQDFAMYSAPFSQDIIKLSASNLTKISKISKGNVIVFVNQEMIIGLVNEWLNGGKVKTLDKAVLTEENDLLAKLFFDREK